MWSVRHHSHWIATGKIAMCIGRVLPNTVSESADPIRKALAAAAIAADRFVTSEYFSTKYWTLSLIWPFMGQIPEKSRNAIFPRAGISSDIIQLWANFPLNCSAFHSDHLSLVQWSPKPLRLSTKNLTHGLFSALFSAPALHASRSLSSCSSCGW